MAFQEIAKKSQLSDQKILNIEMKYISLGLYAQGDLVFAFENACSHDGVPMDEGEVTDCILECPRHFAKFDLKTGKALCLPATSNIKIFPVKIELDSILVDLGEDE